MIVAAIYTIQFIEILIRYFYFVLFLTNSTQNQKILKNIINNLLICIYMINNKIQIIKPRNGTIGLKNNKKLNFRCNFINYLRHKTVLHF
jgi:hypothetical protein